ncbi:MAG: LytTR family transcriptional regulator DNA-binding domain-containing protein [Thermoflexibacter sp.]
MTLTTILIDDERLAISRLKRLLADFQDFIEIIGEATHGQEGIAMIESLRPDLIFLDIEMPAMNGFEMLAQVQFMPKVVFATAFDEYAIRAFEENSIDYLLKPIEKERLEITIQKLKKSTTQQVTDNQYFLKLIEQFKPKKEIQSIAVKLGERILLIRLEDISYFEAEDKYTFLTTVEGKKYLTDYTLASLEEKLPPFFIRVSRSSVINTHLVREIQKYFNGKFILLLNDKNQSKIESGLKYAENIKRLISL